jgi:hypothetical protein
VSGFEATFNLAEAGLWFVISLVLAARAAFGAGNARFTLSLLAGAFFVFGVSDLIEARTGAWWDPLWLLAMKACCLLTFLFGFWKYRQQKSRTRAADKPPERTA